jgi:hypothetical protein
LQTPQLVVIRDNTGILKRRDAFADGGGMLEKAVLRRNSEEHDVAVSRLLDALMYYGHVHLFLDLAGFLSLYDQLGVAQLKTLLSHHGLTFEITPEINAIHTETIAGRRSHLPTFIKAFFPERGNSTVDIIVDRTSRRERRPKPSRRLIESIVRKGRQTNYVKMFGGVDASNDAFFALATDVDTLKLAIVERSRRLKQSINADALVQATLSAERDGNRIVIDSSPDILTLLGQSETGEHWPAILAIVHDYCIELQLSQVRSADVLVSPQMANMSQKRNDLAIQRGIKSGVLIKAFEAFVFDNEVRLGAAYDSGAISFKDALNLIDKGHRFREWLTGVEPDDRLIKEYTDAVQRGTILDTVPGRLGRFALFGGVPTAIGLVNLEAGIAATGAFGLFDAMLTERIAKGWRPNQYIDRVKQALEP